MKWQPTPIFLPEKSHGERNLEVYSPQGHKRVIQELVTQQQEYFFILLMQKFQGNLNIQM